MDNKELLEIGLKFRGGGFPNETWESLNKKHGFPFPSGEAFRSFVKRELKKQNKLPQKDDTRVENKYGEEEFKRVEIEDCGDYYHIYSKQRSIEITKEKVRLIKLLYCDDDPLTINELCRKVNIPRRDFMLVKSAFNITHDDVPYLDEDLDNNMDALVDETLERKKEKYFIKLQQREIQFMKEELNRYRKNDYAYDKLIQALSEVKFEIPERPHRVYQSSKRNALLDLADIHAGLKCENYWNKYNVAETERRFKKLTEEAICIGIENNIDEMHVSNLGDAIAGLIHESIRLESEISVNEQVKLVVRLIGEMLLAFSHTFNKVVYADVVGNHGRMMPQKEASLTRENFEDFIGWALRLMLANEKNIIFEDNFYDEGIIAKRISDVLIFEAHGDMDQFNKVASNFSMMIEKPAEIHLAHFHHEKSEEFNCVDVSISRSFCGIDTYSKNRRLFAKAGQTMYIYENGKRKYTADIILN